MLLNILYLLRIYYILMLLHFLSIFSIFLFLIYKWISQQVSPLHPKIRLDITKVNPFKCSLKKISVCGLTTCTGLCKVGQVGPLLRC